MAGFEPAASCSQSRRANQAALHPGAGRCWGSADGTAQVYGKTGAGLGSGGRPRPDGLLRGRTAPFPSIADGANPRARGKIGSVVKGRGTGEGKRRREAPAQAKPPGELLAPYHAKRDFTRTPEPAGETPQAAADGPLRFVVQRHRARRRHYDLRFEMNGVLASWAVPNGPTLDPAAKRLAVHVEDHPIEYIDFEGVIPAGEYGGGDVIVWDTGTWEPHETDDPVAAVAAGELHADVTGHKLKGRLILVQRGRSREDSNQWLLMHKNDEFAVPGWDAEDYPRVGAQRPDQRSGEGGPGPDLAVRPARGGGVGRAAPAARSGSERGGARGARRAWQRRDLARVRPRAAADESGQGAVPGAVGRACGDQARARQVRRPDRPGDPALPGGRPLNMNRFPGGAGRPGFWNKQLPDHAPAWLPRWHNPDAKEGRTTTYLVVDEPAALVWVANYGALEWHAWTSLRRGSVAARPTR